MIDIEELDRIDEAELVPALRAREELSGFPLESIGGKWLLAHGGLAPELDEFRDRMDDESRLNDSVKLIDVYEVGRLMLRVNYDLTEDEVIVIMGKANPKDLTKAVMGALFGDEDQHRTYSQWARAAFYTAGLNPDLIPPDMVPIVLEQLVMLGRAVPIDKFTDAAIAAPGLKATRAKAKAHAEAKARAEAEKSPAVAESTAKEPTDVRPDPNPKELRRLLEADPGDV